MPTTSTLINTPTSTTTLLSTSSITTSKYIVQNSAIISSPVSILLLNATKSNKATTLPATLLLAKSSTISISAKPKSEGFASSTFGSKTTLWVPLGLKNNTATSAAISQIIPTDNTSYSGFSFDQIATSTPFLAGVGGLLVSIFLVLFVINRRKRKAFKAQFRASSLEQEYSTSDRNAIKSEGEQNSYVTNGRATTLERRDLF